MKNVFHNAQHSGLSSVRRDLRLGLCFALFLLFHLLIANNYECMQAKFDRRPGTAQQRFAFDRTCLQAAQLKAL